MSRCDQRRAAGEDLHVLAGYPPVLRLHGNLTELSEPLLTGEEVHTLLTALCRPDALGRLAAT